MSDENGNTAPALRISPDEVKQAYIDTDMVPRHATMHEVRFNSVNEFSGLPYAAPQHCGCAIGTLYAKATGFFHKENNDPTKDAYQWANSLYGEHYTNGFILGFDAFVRDGVGLVLHPDDVRTRFREGADDGALVARECYPVVRP